MHKKSPVSCQNVASLLMDYFKALPEPLLTFELEPKFIEVAKDPDISDDRRIKEIQSLIQQLPLVNRQTAKLYFDHLRRVTEHSEVNHMTETNIVICVVGGRPVTPIYVLFLKHFEEIFLGVSGKENENFKKENLIYTISTSEGFDFVSNEEEEEEEEEGEEDVTSQEYDEMNFKQEIKLEEENEEENFRKVSIELVDGSLENLENIKLMLNQSLFQDLSNKPGRKQIQTSFIQDKETMIKLNESELMNRFALLSPKSNEQNPQVQELKVEGKTKTSPVPVGSKKHSKRSRKNSTSSYHSRSESTDIPTDVDGYVDSPCDSETNISPRGNKHHMIKNKILETLETQLDKVEKIHGNDTEYEDLVQDIIKRANQKFGQSLLE